MPHTFSELSTMMMMIRFSLLVVLLSLLNLGQAFVASPSFVRPQVASFMAPMAQPETTTKTKVKTKEKTKQKQKRRQKSETDEPVSRRDEEFQDAPMFKLMLLADNGYDAEHVVTRMCAIMEDLDEDAAATVFQQAQQEGKAMCGKYPFERAELFKEQLIRSNPMIFSDLEEENA